MKITLNIEPGDALGGSLYYVGSEYSFRFDVGSPVDIEDRATNASVSSLLIGTLQINVAIETGILLYVWGYHPNLQWQTETLENPKYESGIVRLDHPETLRKGVSLGIAKVGDWTTISDPDSGWIRVASSERLDERQVLIASDVVLGISDSELCSVWLRPVYD